MRRNPKVPVQLDFDERVAVFNELVAKYLRGEINRAQVTAADPFIDRDIQAINDAYQQYVSELKAERLKAIKTKRELTVKARKRKSRLWRLWYRVVEGKYGKK